MIENIYTLSYYHHRIESMNSYPLFRVRSWNNGVRCMSLCVLIEENKVRTKISILYSRNIYETHSPAKSQTTQDLSEIHVYSCELMQHMCHNDYVFAIPLKYRYRAIECWTVDVQQPKYVSAFNDIRLSAGIMIITKWLCLRGRFRPLPPSNFHVYDIFLKRNTCFCSRLVVDHVIRSVPEGCLVRCTERYIHDLWRLSSCLSCLVVYWSWDSVILNFVLYTKWPLGRIITCWRTLRIWHRIDLDTTPNPITESVQPDSVWPLV